MQNKIIVLICFICISVLLVSCINQTKVSKNIQIENNPQLKNWMYNCTIYESLLYKDYCYAFNALVSNDNSSCDKISDTRINESCFQDVNSINLSDELKEYNSLCVFSKKMKIDLIRFDTKNKPIIEEQLTNNLNLSLSDLENITYYYSLEGNMNSLIMLSMNLTYSQEVELYGENFLHQTVVKNWAQKCKLIIGLVEGWLKDISEPKINEQICSLNPGQLSEYIEVWGDSFLIRRIE